MTDSFDIKGFEKFGELGELLKKDVKNQIDLAAKTSVNKTADLVAYGKITGINEKGGNSKGIVVTAAKTLRIPVEHIYYRTFIQGVKVTEGKGGRGIKPYASLMIRGNGISVVNLLARGAAVKAMYGFTTRKKKVGSKTKPNLKNRISGARRKGSVVINGKTYADAVIGDGSYRNSSDKVNKYYMEKLGAGSRKLAGKQTQVFRRKNKNQKLPYPVDVVKISKKRVMGALLSAVRRSKSVTQRDIDIIMVKEVKRRMKRLGFDLK